MNEIMQINNAFIAVKDGLILDFGDFDYAKYLSKDTVVYDGQGLLVVPGLIDSHTHLVHGGSREHEFALKIAGVPYLEILEKGGGILSTVTSTRESSKEALYIKALKSLNEMLLLGVTTIEAKSGYGLNLETEMKQLEVAKELSLNHSIDIVSTYLGAHATPPEFKNNKIEYLNKNIITVYYEWCGGSIQKNSALTGFDKKAFIFQHFKISPIEQVLEISLIDTPFSLNSLTEEIKEEFTFDGLPQCLPCNLTLEIP